MLQIWKYVESEVCGVVILETLSVRIAPIENLKDCSGSSLFSADYLVPFDVWVITWRNPVLCVHMHICMHSVCVYMYMHVCTQPQIVCMCTLLCMHALASVCVCVCVCVCVWLCVCVCVCACVWRETFSFLKYGKLLDKLRDCQLLKKGHVLWGYV